MFTIAATDPRIEPELERNVEESWVDLASIFKQWREAYREILKPQLDAQRLKD